MNSLAHSVMLVDSASHAIRIEKTLVGCNLPCKLIPVPRHLSSDCGVCVRILSENKNKIERLLLENKIRIQSIEDL